MSTSTERMRRLRERRAKAIEADTARLRDTGELLAPAVAETLAALDLKSEDAAAAHLALRYAQIIDECRDPAWGLRWVGPHMLAALESLGATPVSRAKLKKDPPPHVSSRLDELRMRRVQVPGHGPGA